MECVPVFIIHAFPLKPMDKKVPWCAFVFRTNDTEHVDLSWLGRFCDNLTRATNCQDHMF